MTKNYESEITQFIKQYKDERPETDASQRDGRNRLWDKQLDAEQQEGFKQARVPQAPYVYYQND